MLEERCTHVYAQTVWAPAMPAVESLQITACQSTLAGCRSELKIFATHQQLQPKLCQPLYLRCSNNGPATQTFPIWHNRIYGMLYNTKHNCNNTQRHHLFAGTTTFLLRHNFTICCKRQQAVLDSMLLLAAFALPSHSNCCSRLLKDTVGLITLAAVQTI
jgi:hypothetical protein